MKKAEIMVNGEWLPMPDEDPKFLSEKIKVEHETAAGTTMINIVRKSKLTISGTWTLSREWAYKFRTWMQADTVMISAFYPNPETMSEYTCQFEIKEETHVREAKKQVPESGGIYQISVEIKEL